MIVAVEAGMTARGHLISPSCPQPLFQSEIKGKAIDMNFFFFIFTQISLMFALSLVLKTRVFGIKIVVQLR